MEDEEQVVFNAMVKENEMIITIEEYTDMKKHIECLESNKKAMQNYVHTFERKEKELLDENQQILTEIENYKLENQKLKRGIVNFIKGLGG
ncbi:MAG: hypothetical protein HFJ48_00860 [Clostridia bacterium]|nr:hypothetical protein [Clostridia bacterium]